MKKSLYLVDISSFIFRAYYAVRPLTTSQGVPVNAVFGVVSMLNRLIGTRKPDHLIVCCDRPEPGFREEIYADYKANRSAPPEDLVPQFPLIQEFIRAYPVRVLEMPGYEADDIIATLVERFRKDPEMEIFVVTQDKDLMQLVCDNVCLYDAANDKLIKEPQVLEKFGVQPALVADVQSLCGDPTDNIPGIDGIGPKTAAKLIQEYGSLAGVLENATKLTGKMRDKILAGRDRILISQKLVTLDREVPLTSNWEDLTLPLPDVERLNAFYKKVEFKSLIRAPAGGTAAGPGDPSARLRFTQDDSEGHAARSQGIPLADTQSLPIDRKPGAEFVLISSPAALQEVVGRIRAAKPPWLAFDTETDSLDTHTAKLVGISFCFELGRGYYVPIGHAGGGNVDLMAAREIFGPVLADPAITKVAQNAKFDVNVLSYHSMTIAGLAEDTLLAAYLIDPEGQHGLNFLARRYLRYEMLGFSEVVPKGKTFADVTPELAARYSAEDAWATFMLRPILRALVGQADLEKVYDGIEVPLSQVLARMECHGVLVDQAQLNELKQEFTHRLEKLTADIHKLAGMEFNINSTKQLAEVLFKRLKLPCGKKGKTGYSTDVDVLTELSLLHELPRRVLEYRSLSKLLGTYVEGLKALIHPRSGRVHTSFNQTIAATGRLSSTEPNLQNIPIRTEEGRRIREVFVAPPGHVLLSADYSQIELRLLAALSQDPNLIDAYRKDQDIHARTASHIFGVSLYDVTVEQRAVGKTINFGVVYGQSAFGLAQQLAVPQAEAKHFIDSFYREFARVRDYKNEVLARARDNGYVCTVLGRRRYVPDINSVNSLKRQMAERAAFNAVFQGSAADLVKAAMLRVDEKIRAERWGTCMVLQVHDELVFEVPLEELKAVTDWVPRLMTLGFDANVPLKVSVGSGRNWSEAH